MTSPEYEDADPIKMARKHATAAENALRRHAIDSSFFVAAVEMAKMWSAIAQAEAATRGLTNALRADDTALRRFPRQTGPLDKGMVE